LSRRSSPRAARLPPKAREALRHAEKIDVTPKSPTSRRKVRRRAEKFSDEQAIGENEQAISAAGRRSSPEARDVLRKLAIGALEQAIFPGSRELFDARTKSSPERGVVLRKLAEISESGRILPTARDGVKETR